MSVNIHPSQKSLTTQARAGEETSKPVPAIINKDRETTVRQEHSSEMKEVGVSACSESESKQKAQNLEFIVKMQLHRVTNEGAKIFSFFHPSYVSTSYFL